LVPALEKYLGATVDVVNVPGGGGAPPEDQTAHAIPNGLTIGFLFPLSCALGTLTNIPFVNFNPKHVAFIAGTGPSVQVLISSPTSSYKTFDSLETTSSPAGALTESLGTTYDTLLILKQMFKLNINLVTGYSSVANVLSGFIRGDGPVSIGSLSNFGPTIAGGLATPLAITAKIPVGTNYRKYLLNTPIISQLLNKLPGTTKSERTQKTGFADLLANTGQPIFTQQRVPAARLQVLREAVAWAYAQQSVKAQLLNEGDTDVYVSPEKAKAEYDASLIDGASLASSIAKYL
jgi:tripartite-type tricarboxylate transporter receptor subunit TctC